LKFEDLLVEYPEIQEAVKRLPKEEQEARMKRIQLAVQLNGTAKILPKEQWTTPEQDKPYLRDYILQVQQEIKEREAYRRK
jgi:ubiquinol-cytochrome c reductase subunit 7